jgi:hypothetical protein
LLMTYFPSAEPARFAGHYLFVNRRGSESTKTLAYIPPT